MPFPDSTYEQFWKQARIASRDEMLDCLRKVSAALVELDDDWRGMNERLVDQILCKTRYMVADCVAKAEGRE